VSLLEQGVVERLILCAPPGSWRAPWLSARDMREKVDPYLRPIYDGLHDFMAHAWSSVDADRMIEVAPLAFMRGRTLTKHSVCSTRRKRQFDADEDVPHRLGEGSRMIVTGDPRKPTCLRAEVRPRPSHRPAFGLEDIGM